MLPQERTARGKAKFTDRAVKNLRPRGSRYELWEGSGFGIRVTPSGTKSWVFVYHHVGRARRMTLGIYPAMTVAQAHLAHGKALADLEQGTDPGALIVRQRRVDRAAPTVGEPCNRAPRTLGETSEALLEGRRADSRQGRSAALAMGQGQGDHARRRHRLARPDRGSRRTDCGKPNARRGEADVQLRSVSRPSPGQPLRAGKAAG